MTDFRPIHNIVSQWEPETGDIVLRVERVHDAPIPPAIVARPHTERRAANIEDLERISPPETEDERFQRHERLMLYHTEQVEQMRPGYVPDQPVRLYAGDKIRLKYAQDCVAMVLRHEREMGGTVNGELTEYARTVEQVSRGAAQTIDRLIAAPYVPPERTKPDPERAFLLGFECGFYESGEGFNGECAPQLTISRFEAMAADSWKQNRHKLDEPAPPRDGLTAEDLRELQRALDEWRRSDTRIDDYAEIEASQSAMRLLDRLDAQGKLGRAGR